MPASPTPRPPRASFLSILTVAMALVGIGTAAGGFIGSLSPSADVAAQMRWVEIKLSDIPEGSDRMVRVRGYPIVIRHRTAGEIEQAETVLLADLPDRTSTDLSGREIGTADDSVRRITPDGRYIALRITGHFGCVAISGAGDFEGWFDPCYGGQFDTSGRIRRGPGQNMSVPVHEMIGPDVLRLALSPDVMPKEILDELLYR